MASETELLKSCIKCGNQMREETFASTGCREFGERGVLGFLTQYVCACGSRIDKSWESAGEPIDKQLKRMHHLTMETGLNPTCLDVPSREFDELKAACRTDPTQPNPKLDAILERGVTIAGCRFVRAAP